MTSMQSPTVALVSATERIQFPAVTAVAAALQRQVIEDFQPVWGGTATVVAVQSVKEIPHYAWPVIVLDKDLGGGALGYHLDQNNRPYAFVEATASWTLTASHEMLEMLADPFGNRKQIAASLAPERFSGNLQYLVELCDPCEAPEFSYTKNGVPVSDFITPDFYHTERPGTHYSFRGNIARPVEILEGGYISFLDPNQGLWFQGFVQNGALSFKQLPPEDSIRSFRSYVNRHAPHQPPALTAEHKTIRRAQELIDEHRASNSRHADAFIEHLRKAHPQVLTGDSLIDVDIGSVNIF